MFCQIIPSRSATFRQAIVRKSRNMALQYGLPEAARSAVRQQQQALSIKAGLLETVVIHNLLHLLQFSEMVTAANRSQGAAPGMGQ